jgi:hypothetical protein
MYFFMRVRGKRGLGSGLLIAASLVVCHAQILPSYPDAAAKVISLTGQVSVLHDSEPWVLNVGDSVQARQVIVTGPDGFAKFQVSDGSTFEVYPNSNVVFRKNPPNWGDLLDALAGRVRIHIQRFMGQPNPNRILTPTAVISVRGTTFDVSVEEADETTQVDVEEGTVVVWHALLPSDHVATLHAGESIRVYKNVPIASSQLDKNTVFRYALNALREAAMMLTSHGAKITLPGASGGGSGIPGDTCKPGVAGCTPVGGTSLPGTSLPTPPPPPPPAN